MSDQIVHSHNTDAPAEERMRSLLEVVSSYIEQYHGGWVRMVDFDGKVLKVEMGGACEGCSLSKTTLHGWVEGAVRQFFPEIERIEAV
ncbi:MAG: NifU family protein [Anaerolineales bacterium]|nr:NifU family protein [Anaerolineales bacterium]